jgi:hypothetical protein
MKMNTTIKVSKDGDTWCAAREGFRNLQEDPAGFGDDPQDAVKSLLDNEAKLGITEDKDLVVNEDQATRDAAAARIFANALGGLLRLKGDAEGEENEGVVVLVDGHKYVVFVAPNNAINITNVDDKEDLIPGIRLWLHFEDDASKVPKDATVLSRQELATPRVSISGTSEVIAAGTDSIDADINKEENPSV